MRSATLLPLTSMLLLACDEDEDAPASASASELSGLQEQLDAVQQLTEEQSTTIGVLESRLSTLEAENQALKDDLDAVDGRTQVIEASYVDSAAVSGLLDYITVDTEQDAVYFTGANVYIRSGSGETHVPNGLGNLIIGYNIEREEGADRTGSHNMVIGDLHNYSSHSGLLTGAGNSSGHQGAVAFGFGNQANGFMSAVLGGSHNSANGQHSVVSGGGDNTASGDYASVSGGTDNTVSGQYASVSGGRENRATGEYALSAGGVANKISGVYAAGVGGYFSAASGENATLLGGAFNTSGGNHSVTSGGYENAALEDYDYIVGN